jgi:hypothetical protein
MEMAEVEAETEPVELGETVIFDPEPEPPLLPQPTAAIRIAIRNKMLVKRHI